MDTKHLTEAVLDGGIRAVNFFNGRLLSGEDLSQEQTANRQARSQLGQALGEGVAYGLEVVETQGVSTKTAPVVTVAAGLAINREGQTLALAANTDVSLVRPLNGNTPSSDAVFVECQPPQSGVYIAGAGVYLLTIAPATAGEGRAPVSGLGNVTAACNTRCSVAGVQFRLLQLDLTLAELNDANHLRNLIAYKCFGTAEAKSFFANPLGPALEQYGLLDTLRPKHLTDGEVPLAILYWTATNGIEFFDLWSVRRRVTQRTQDIPWRLLTSDRRGREAEAMFLQFQDQVQDIRRKETNLNTLVAADRFTFLPPLGLLPITAPASFLTIKNTAASTGFTPQVFFGAHAPREVALLDAKQFRQLFHEALHAEPISLQDNRPLQLYLLWENIQAVESGAVSQLVLVFATPALPYHGVARFGYAKWNLSRVAPSVL